MKTVRLTPTFTFGFLIALLSVNMAVDVSAQSATAQSLINQLLSVEKNKRTRWFPRAELAREIARDESIWPKNRMDALKAVLREELENPCPLQEFIHGGYATPTVHIQGQYLFGFQDIGTEAIPYLRRHLDQLKLEIQNISPSLGNQNDVRVVELQYILCALGLLGDKESFTEVLTIVEDEDEDVSIRQKAIMALEKLKNKEAIPALKRALKDDFRIDFTSRGFPRTIYPIRERAYGALLKLGVEVVFEGIGKYRVVR